MTTSETQVVIVVSVIALISLAYIVGTVFATAVRMVRNGFGGLEQRRRWQSRLVKYLLVATPIVSSGSLMNQRQVSAEAVQRDINNEEFCIAPQEVPTDNNRKIIGFISTAVGVGLLMRLRSKRQQSERQDISVEAKALQIESALTATTDELAMARLDLALRSLSPSMIKLLRMVITSSDAAKAEFVEAVQAEGPWTQLSPRVFELNGSVELDTLVLLAHGNDAVPVLFPVGTTAVGEVWINLDVVGSFGIEAEDELAEKVWNGIVQSLSLSPFAHAVSLVGGQSVDLPGRRVIVARENSHELMSALMTEDSLSVLLLEKQPTEFDCPVIYRGRFHMVEQDCDTNTAAGVCVRPK